MDSIDKQQDVASFTGHTPPLEKVAWYPLFAQPRNLPEILVNRELSCFIVHSYYHCSILL